MKKFALNAFAFMLSLFAVQSINAQDVLFEESFETGLGGFVVEGYNGQGDNIWRWDANYKAAVADAYGKIDSKEDVVNHLVSPVIALGKNNTVTFDYFDYYFADITQDAGVFIREEGAAEWTKVTFDFTPDLSEPTNAGEIALPVEFEGKNAQIGFLYHTPGSNSSGYMTINNFVVKGEPMPAPEPEGNVIFKETFETGLGEFVVEGNNGLNDNIWRWDANYKAAYADAYGRIDLDEEILNYLVSPVIALGKNNTISLDYFDYYFPDVTQDAGIVIREEGATEWTKVTFDFKADLGEAENTGEIALPAEFEGKKAQIGFMYHTPGSNSSGVMMIQNFVVKGEAMPEPEPEPEPEGNVIFKETFETGLGEFVVEGNNGGENTIWSWDEGYKAAIADAYGKIDNKEDVVNYLVSPMVTLGMNNIASYNQFNVYFTDVNTEIGLYIRPEGAAEWTRVEFELEADNGGIKPTGDIIIPADYNGMNVQFGFKYHTPGSLASGILTINNFVVKGEAMPEPEPEPQGNVLFEEKFLEDMGGFTVEGYNGDEHAIWMHYVDEEISCVIADGYGKISGGMITNYLVSPEIQLETENCINFKQVHYYFSDVASEAGLFIRKAGTTEWTDMNVVLPETNGLEEIGNIAIPSEFNNQKVQFGFKYSADGGGDSGAIYLTDIVVSSNVSTGIENVVTETEGDGKIYDLQGRRVLNPTKGLYIVNGKKVIIR